MRSLFLLLLLVVTCGCGDARDETGLVGKWKQDATGGGGSRTLEFRNDGTYTEMAGGLTTRGKWEVTNGNQLTFSMEVMGESMGTTFGMEFQDGDLMLGFTEDGSPMRYKRAE